ncbi:TPA: Bcr/CflA family drug resistance efflux transporter, partial [Salmonella enterica subsp. diarizonae serovar 61:r:-]
GLSSPLLLGISLHGHPELSGTGSALQGALKMAGSAIVLWFFADGETTSAIGLMEGLFILSLISLILILLAKYFILKSLNQSV